MSSCVFRLMVSISLGSPATFFVSRLLTMVSTCLKSHECHVTQTTKLSVSQENLRLKEQLSSHQEQMLKLKKEVQDLLTAKEGLGESVSLIFFSPA